MDFSLSPAKPFRGQVVDNKGRPVAGAQVQSKWQECYFLDWKAMTDADGRFVWLSGPTEGEIEFTSQEKWVHVRHSDAGSRPWQATSKSRLIRRSSVRGTVIDAETSQPIPLFRVIEGEALGNQRTFWRSRNGTSATKDTSTYPPSSIDQPGVAFFIRIEADGYLPASSRAIIPGEKTVDLEFKLKKGTGPSGIVRLPDGSPAIGADVYLNSSKYGLPLENNQQRFLRSGMDTGSKPTTRGVLRFSPRMSRSGSWCCIPRESPRSRLRSWPNRTHSPSNRSAGSKGSSSRDGPGAKQEHQSAARSVGVMRHDHQFQFFHYTAQTDDQRTFRDRRCHARRGTSIPDG